jgi:hypothetical protein
MPVNNLPFTAEKNPEKALVKPFKLYYYTAANDSATVIAGTNIGRYAC